jgi:hypothetical protein
MYGGSEKYFTGLQQIQWAALQEAGNRHDGAGAGLFAPPQAETVKYIRGISEMYRRDLELLQGSDIDVSCIRILSEKRDLTDRERNKPSGLRLTRFSSWQRYCFFRVTDEERA